jgi:dTMP kinase
MRAVRDLEFAGDFIAIEGCDGAGKTIQTKRLAENLRDRGEEVLKTQEPTDFRCGKAVYDAIENDLSPEAAGMQFAADRLQHLERRIEPALSTGKTVVCDRYAHSSLAYQPALQHRNREVDLERVHQFNREITRPDLTVLLDIDPSVGLERVRRRDKEVEEYEGIDLQRQVRRNYLELAGSEPEVVIVDGSGSKDEVEDRVLDLVASELE